jgi:hypothetical protein
MIELSFHKELYDAGAIDEATKTYARFGTFELKDEPTHFVLRVTAHNESREARLSRELANFALGLTIERYNAGSAGESSSR